MNITLSLDHALAVAVGAAIGIMPYILIRGAWKLYASKRRAWMHRQLSYYGQRVSEIVSQRMNQGAYKGQCECGQPNCLNNIMQMQALVQKDAAAFGDVIAKPRTVLIQFWIWDFKKFVKDDATRGLIYGESVK